MTSPSCCARKRTWAESRGDAFVALCGETHLDWVDRLDICGFVRRNALRFERPRELFTAEAPE
jgi:hypothetical protein